MKLTIEVSLLSEMLDLASKFIAKSSTLPILENVYIAIVNNELILKATDMEKYILITLPIDKGDEWWITVGAKNFTEIIKTIEDEYVDLTVNNNDILSIKSSKDSFLIKWIPLQEFVALPELREPQKISIPVSTFTNWVWKVEFAVLEKNFSPVFTWVVMTSKQEEKNNQLVFVGTDSYRLAEYKTPYDGDFKEFKLIIPKSSINDIKRVGEYCLNKQQNNNVNISYANNMVLFEFTVGNMIIKTNSLLIQGNFPDYDNEKIVPKQFNTTITIDSNATERAIKKIGILTKDNNNFIHIVSKDSTLEITSGSTDLWNADTSIASILSWTDIDVWLNGKHIVDFLRVVGSDRVNMHFVNNTSPIVMTEPDGTGYKYIIRPVK